MSQAKGKHRGGGLGALTRQLRERMARWWSTRHYRPERRYMRGAKAGAK